MRISKTSLPSSITPALPMKSNNNLKNYGHIHLAIAWILRLLIVESPQKSRFLSLILKYYRIITANPINHWISPCWRVMRRKQRGHHIMYEWYVWIFSTIVSDKCLILTLLSVMTWQQFNVIIYFWLISCILDISRLLHCSWEISLSIQVLF